MTPALPLVVGWGSALLLATLDGRRRWVGVLAVGLGLGLVGSIAVLAGRVAATGPASVVTGGWPAEVGIRLRADDLGCLFALVSAVLLVAVLVFEVARGPETRSFPALVLFLATGLTGLFLTGDAFNFYVFFELSMVSAFALAGYGGGPAESRAAAVFVVINLYGSVLFLGAVGMIYRLTGTLDMAAVAAQSQEAAPGVLLLVAAVLFVALGLKLGLFPFHYWLPVVYRESRPAVAAIYAGALANLASYGLLRFGGEVLPGALEAGRPALLLLGGASILYGGVQAVRRRDLSDMVAYSSIGQVGYTVLALAVAGPVGLAAAVIYTLANSLHKTTLFLGAGAAGRGVAAGMLVAGMSVAGLPPSAGFVGKVAVFRAGVAADSATLVAVMALGSALSFVYVLQAWQHAYWGEGAAGEGSSSPAVARALVAALALGVVALGLWPGPLVEWSQRAAAVLGSAP